MKTKVNEIRIRVEIPVWGNLFATVEDGEVTKYSVLSGESPDISILKAYIQFYKEVIEAIEETK